MNPSDIIQKIRQARSVWVELGDGKKIQIIRPTQYQTFQKFFSEDSHGNSHFSVTFENTKDFIVSWDGFTEADLLGPEIGSSDPIAYQPDFFEEYLFDKTEWMPVIVQALVQEIGKANTKKAENIKK